MATAVLTDDLVSEIRIEEGQLEIYDLAFSGLGSFGLRVGSAGRKSFFVILRMRGRRKRMNVGSWPGMDVESARERAYILAQEVLHGHDPVAESRRQQRLPDFAGLADSYLASERYQSLAASTQGEYLRIIRRELLPRWSDLSIADVSSDSIAQLIAECALERGKVTLANRVRAVASAVFRYSVENGLLFENPVQDTTTIEEDPKPRPPLDFDDLRLLWQQVSASNQRLDIALRLFIVSAQKLSDVVQMQWSDIQMDCWYPGSNRSRPIHLHPTVFSGLRVIQNEQGARRFVFEDDRGLTPRDLRKRCAQLGKLCGIDGLNPSRIRSCVEAEFLSLRTGAALLAYVFGRKTLLKQLKIDLNQQHYLRETQKLYVKWVRRLNGQHPKESGEAKVIPLFGGGVRE